MTDILIRDVPTDVVAAVEATAKRLGLSRNEYLRRQLVREASRATGTLTMDDLAWFAETFPDLDDTDVMVKAWE